MIISLLSISFIHLLAVMSPGPDVALTVRNSVLYGRRSGLFTSLGIVCGNMFLVAGAVFGISALINGIPSLRSVIMLIGGIYLIYMGLSSARTISDTTVDNFSDNSEKKSFFSGFITNVTNVKAGLYYVSIFSKFITDDVSITAKLIYCATVLFVTLLWFSLAAITFASTPIRSRYMNKRRLLELLMGIVLIILGMFIIFEAVKLFFF
ncbi:MAG TPA: LysE family translocator [Spirochaetota bacterium]|jgi:threonine/homoserine/homoserine lactone efflux protein|nr:LysE family translocator [Spirochaetota bacterium]HPM34501.1 LysE family translocator [Spirochaetota bacterium]